MAGNLCHSSLESTKAIDIRIYPSVRALVDEAEAKITSGIICSTSSCEHLCELLLGSSLMKHLKVVRSPLW